MSNGEIGENPGRLVGGLRRQLLWGVSCSQPTFPTPSFQPHPYYELELCIPVPTREWEANSVYTAEPIDVVEGSQLFQGEMDHDQRHYEIQDNHRS